VDVIKLSGGYITIVALGDSIVAGAPGDRQTAWPALLAGHLRRAYPRADWRVVNAGVPGDTAPLGYARFERDVAAAGPRCVLIAFGLNDCYPARYGLDRWLEAEVPRGLNRSYLWRAIMVRITSLGRRFGWLSAPQPETSAALSPPRTSAQGFAAALDALIAKTRLIGAQPVLLTMTPLATPLAEAGQARAETYPVYNRIIRARGAALGVTLVQLTSELPRAAFESDGVHLTPGGQAWVAEQVFRQGEAIGMWLRLAQEVKP
jgi:lysophospholipase L1-like esterase